MLETYGIKSDDKNKFEIKAFANLSTEIAIFPEPKLEKVKMVKVVYLIH